MQHYIPIDDEVAAVQVPTLSDVAAVSAFIADLMGPDSGLVGYDLIEGGIRIRFSGARALRFKSGEWVVVGDGGVRRVTADEFAGRYKPAPELPA